MTKQIVLFHLCIAGLLCSSLFSQRMGTYNITAHDNFERKYICMKLIKISTILQYSLKLFFFQSLEMKKLTPNFTNWRLGGKNWVSSYQTLLSLGIRQIHCNISFQVAYLFHNNLIMHKSCKLSLNVSAYRPSEQAIQRKRRPTEVAKWFRTCR